jgi:hypothetical protein
MYGFRGSVSLFAARIKKLFIKKGEGDGKISCLEEISLWKQLFFFLV